MNQELAWDACRYVLEDPTLDRDVFEQRMLDDVQLAMAVAEAVAQVQLMQAAARQQLPLTIPPHQARRSFQLGQSTPLEPGAFRWQSVASLAAALLLAIGLFSYGLIQVSQNREKLVLTEQRILAQHWLALHESDLGLEIISEPQSRHLPVSSAEATAIAMLDHPVNSWAESDWTMASETATEPAAAADDEDWLIDAARQYYAQFSSPGAAS